jgi:cytochrome c553
MKPQTEDLTPAEMKALGHFFEAKVVGPRPARDKELLAVGKFIFERGNQFSGLAACSTCHGPKGLGTPQLPRLAGQHRATSRTSSSSSTNASGPTTTR